MSTYSVHLHREVLAALVRAWRTRHTAALNNLDVPPVGPNASLSRTTAQRLAGRIGWFVKILFFWKLGQCCFYRCYAIACILRTRGVPVVLNIGLLQPTSAQDAFGHCWLTLDGELFAEKGDPRSQYPIEVARTKQGFTYWFGPSGSHSHHSTQDLLKYKSSSVGATKETEDDQPIEQGKDADTDAVGPE